MEQYLESIQSSSVIDHVNATIASDWSWTPIEWSWWIIIQLVLAILGISGNLLVILVLFQRRSYRKPTDILIGGLAAADFITSIFMIPQPKLSGVPDTILGEIACKLIYSSVFLWISISCSVFTLTAISIERYIAVIHPFQFKHWVTPKKIAIWFVIIALVAIAINSRTFGTTWVDGEHGKCTHRYSDKGVQTFSGIMVFLVLFIIPTLIMLVSYSLIARSLRIRSKQYKLQKSGHGSGPSDRLLVARNKVIKLMFVVIVTFIVCWAADSVALLAYNMRWVERSYLYSNVYHVLVVMAYFNTCANPLIYAIHYPEFRLAVKDLFCSSGTVRSSLFGKDYNLTTKGKVYDNAIV
ncbi:kappa-type opioid receptor-like [Lytechinus pictus]|uniref:kappa-type opioid receptor-like n=1 Tax=Lytechinus pictus TaxID=7653 RepID=UPI0030B9CD36